MTRSHTRVPACLVPGHRFWLAAIVGWLGPAPGAAQTPDLQQFDWQAEAQALHFTVAFNAPARWRVTDELLQHKRFYLDFFGLDGPAEPQAWSLNHANIFHVKRIHYPDQRVLRFVFYTRRRDVLFTVNPTDERNFLVRVFTSSSKPLIVIDPGHGGTRSMGARTSQKIDGRHRYEKNIVLDISNKLKGLIDRDPDVEAFMTRTRDEYVSLARRIELANEVGGAVFVSIHLNAQSNSRKTARGFELYFLSDGDKETDRMLLALENDEAISLDEPTSGRDDLREILRGLADDKLKERQAQSEELAVTIDQLFMGVGPFRRHHRGVKSAPFRVLMNYRMPAVLIECGFIDHPADARELLKPAIQGRIANLILQGVKRYLKRSDASSTRQSMRGG